MSIIKIILKSFRDTFRQYRTPLVTGALLGFAFPPFQLGFLMYIGLYPMLFWAQSGSLGTAFKRGYWWGFGFHTAGLFWILNSTVFGGTMALLYLPLYSAVTLLFLRWLHLKYGKLLFVLFPFVWTAIEYVRSLGVLGFPWMSIAYTQTYYPLLIQYVDQTGVYGVTFWICILNVIVFLAVERIGTLAKTDFHGTQRTIIFDKTIIRQVSLFIVVFAIPLGYGMLVMSTGTWLGETLKVSLVQGNVDMNEKTDAELRDPTFKLYETLSLRAAKDRPDLVVWPETAAMAFLDYPSRSKYDLWMKRIVLTTGMPILTGSFGYEEVNNNGKISFNYFNSAVLYDRMSLKKTWYGKIRLVPFGEWFPYEDRFPIFQKLDFGQANFTPGKNHTIFSVDVNTLSDTNQGTAAGRLQRNSIKFSVAICFESIFSDFIQKFSNKGMQFLVVITNNNWFGRTTSLYQHAQISVFRAIENRIGVAHCSNSGISVLIDPYGRVTAESGVFVSDILTGDLYYRNAEIKPPSYVRFGTMFSQTVLIITGVFFLGGFFRKRKNSTVQDKSGDNILKPGVL